MLWLAAPGPPCPRKGFAAELQCGRLLEFKSKQMKGFSSQIPLPETPEMYEPMRCPLHLSGKGTGTEFSLNAAIALLCVSLPHQGKHPKSLNIFVKAPSILQLKQAPRAQEPGLRVKVVRV